VQDEIGLFIRVMILVMLALGAEVANSYWQIHHGLPLHDTVRAAAVIVALVPQGLVFMVTIAYALAAVRMSGKGALIQRMNAVESSSHIRVLCMDKTGTLTTNKLQLQTAQPLAPDLDEAALRALLGVYAASTTAGNKTNDAIAAACPAQPRAVTRAVPFGSKHKWSALVFEDGCYSLGGPDMLHTALPAGFDLGEQGAAWKEQGLRVLLFARAPRDAQLEVAGEPTLPSGIEPLGVLALSDELRPEARETIEGFNKAGITLKVISGDHPETVAALARQAGLDAHGRLVAGHELELMSDVSLAEAAREGVVFGRITPQQKERLVRALREQGQYVAMIGDGVNDVLALKQANLAVAMRSGSQVARSVADIVLLNDSFAVLPAAFLEGQRILRGMQDIVRLFLTRTAYVALIILVTSLLGEQFPVTPNQNALLALLTVGIPTIGLAAWARPGESPERLARASGRFVVPATISIAAVALIVYLFFRAMTDNLDQARTALTTTTVFCGLLLIPFVEPPNEAFAGGDPVSGDRRPTYLALAMLALYILAATVPMLRHFYELQPLPWSAYPMLALCVAGWAVSLRYFWRLRLGERLLAWRAGRRTARA
jgi:cation-transporting ATPase E